MTVTSTKTFKMCMDCMHFITPQHSISECGEPSVLQGMPSMQARDTDGPCGPSAKLYMEKTNGRVS